jgi:hypothetical protein
VQEFDQHISGGLRNEVVVDNIRLAESIELNNSPVGEPYKLGQ